MCHPDDLVGILANAISISLTVENREAFVSTQVLAEGLGLPHEDVLKLSRKYEALLTEDQACLLADCLKDTPKARKFKRGLVEAFRASRSHFKTVHIEGKAVRFIWFGLAG